MSGSLGKKDFKVTRDDEMKWDERPWDLVDWEKENKLPYCQRMWRAKWNLKPRGPQWLPEIIRMTWFLQVIGIVMGIHGGIDGDLGGPFFYSRTSCCGFAGTPTQLPATYDIHWPKTFIDYHQNVSYFRACEVPNLSKDDSAWSHSNYCPNWPYVRAFTQKLNAGRSMSLTMTSLFFMPIGAGWADKRGRKPMFFFGHILGIKSLTCNLLSSLHWFILHDPKAYLLYASGILSGMASGCGPTSMAMMVDLIPGDMREQGFPVLRLFHIPSQLVVFGIGYTLLHKHLSTYTLFWAISLGTDLICVWFFLFFLPESMPDRMKRPLVWQDWFPGTYYFEGVKIVLKYPLLIGLSLCIAIDSFAFRGMGSVAGNQLWMGPLKFKQEEWLIPHLIGMVCGIPANLIGAIVIPRVGVWPAIFFGEICGIILGLGGNMWPIFWMNYYNCWTSVHCGDGTWGTPLFWAKWGGVIATHILGTFVGAISGPAGEAMISMQVSQTEQASIQAAFRLVSALSGMYAPLYFTNHYFNVDWTGWKVISYAWIGYGLHTIKVVLYFLTFLVDRYIIYHNTPRVLRARDFFDAKNKTYAGSFDYRVSQPAGAKKGAGYVRKLFGAHAHEGGNAMTLVAEDDEPDERTPLLSSAQL